MLKPLHDNVILKKEKAQKEVKTASGIILGDPKNDPETAIVEAIGPDCKEDVQVGERVVYKEYTGTTVTIEDDQEYVIVAFKDILAIVA